MPNVEVWVVDFLTGQVTREELTVGVDVSEAEFQKNFDNREQRLFAVTAPGVPRRIITKAQWTVIREIGEMYAKH